MRLWKLNVIIKNRRIDYLVLTMVSFLGKLNNGLLSFEDCCLFLEYL